MKHTLKSNRDFQFSAAMRDPKSTLGEIIAAAARQVPNEKPYCISRAAEHLVRLARSHGNLQAVRCNQTLTQRQEKREERIESDICAIASYLGFTCVEFEGDPRGATVKVDGPSVKRGAFGPSLPVY